MSSNGAFEHATYRLSKSMLDSSVVRNEMSEGLSIGYAHTSTSGRHGSYRAASIQPVPHASCSLGMLVLVTAIVRQESSRARSDTKESALSGRQRSCLAESIHAGTPGKPDSARDGARKIGPEFIMQLFGPMSWISQKSSHALLLDEVGHYGTDLSKIDADARPAFAAQA